VGEDSKRLFFCFYQQKIEWVRLKQKYPDLYEEAKAYEKPNRVNGNVFYWCQNESLEELEKPERMAEILEKWKIQQARTAQSRKNTPLVTTLAGLETNEAPSTGCLICHL
jgi:hypothetical protein